MHAYPTVHFSTTLKFDRHDVCGASLENPLVYKPSLFTNKPYDHAYCLCKQQALMQAKNPSSDKITINQP